MRWYIFIVCCFVGIGSAFAQVEKKGVVYNKEWNIQAKLTTMGWGLGFDWGENKRYDRLAFYHTSFGEYFHTREQRQSFDAVVGADDEVPRSFKFGKINRLYTLHAGMGRKRYISDQSKYKGVALAVNYSGGLSLGLVRPYYLKLYKANAQTGILETTDHKYEDDKAAFLNINNIFGGAGYFKGFNEVSLVPGLYGKFGMQLDWRAYSSLVSYLEVGVMAEVFTKEIQLVAVEEGKPYFLNLYLSIGLGKRR